MVIAVLDVLLTILLPLLMGVAITYTTPSGALFMHPAEQLLLGRSELNPVRVLPLLLPVVWQPVAGTYLLVERLFGVLVIGAIGMGLGRVGRALGGHLRRSRSGS
ncbi:MULTISPECIES: hypothetical protein [Streptomyces]|uniref:Integral membrane protein n=1 Tax=Streptomyces griseiscabiei TaxID=2993540 RepID=A0ABU4LJS9_9ACTN|nr:MULTISPECIES: hypothetical protein [Streptomyces]MBZ3908555.1 hypothetical protein [Streptomyces griseiscabiei]MDX2916064.1 hypothetical protein [Streptomyces griseiscabiei]